MASETRSRTRPRTPLSRERVLAAAIKLADDGGIESLTMRKLAQELGVEAMSLYNHVANKGDLVDGMVELAVGEIELPSDEDWEAAIRTCAISAHEMFLRHPWACSCVMGSSSTGALRLTRLDYMEWLLGRLREAGFSPDLIYHAYHALDSHIVGYTLWQLGHAAAAQDFLGGQDFADVAARLLGELRAGGYPNIADHAEQHIAQPAGDGAREFEFGLDLILEGLKRAQVDA